MHVRNLRLSNYRNYENLYLDFSKRLNIIYGDNGQGKTNIIEAIFLCASGRSHRTSKDSEMLGYGKEFFHVELSVEKKETEREIEITYNNNGRKRIRVNEIPLKKMGELMGNLNAVVFSPEDLLMIKQGPAERRRFINIMLSQIRPAYFFYLQQYEKILCQRNILLKTAALKNEINPTIDVWNRHIANYGTKVVKARQVFIKRLNELVGERHSRLTNNEEKLEIVYCPTFPMEEDADERTFLEKYIKILEKDCKKELQRGITLTGPHRDDMEIVLNGRSTKTYGSQGQQRTAALSLKMAEIDLMKEEIGENPVLLLDDVLSELDDKRKEYLFESIEDIQTFITYTNKVLYGKDGKETAFFRIKSGKIVK